MTMIINCKGRLAPLLLPVSPPSQGRKVEITIKEQEMKNQQKKTTPVFRKKFGWVLPTAVLAVMPLAAPAAIAVATAATTMACDNGTTPTPTPETKQKFSFNPEISYNGKEISFECLPSQKDAVESKLKTAVEDILGGTDPDTTTFKNIVGTHGLRIIIENGTFYTGYASPVNNGIIKLHYEYVIVADPKVGIKRGVVDNMTAMLNNQFNNAKETIRLAHRCQAPLLGPCPGKTAGLFLQPLKIRRS
jgi:hypothetical protein